MTYYGLILKPMKGNTAALYGYSVILPKKAGKKSIP